MGGGRGRPPQASTREMTRIVLRHLAEKDIHEARAWYEGEDPRVGFAFVEELRHAISRIRESPLEFRQLQHGVRRTLLHRFPYAVYFILRREEAIVLAVLHQRRRPGEWQRRARRERAP
jgi:plasmid stabilization system protein ParE